MPHCATLPAKQSYVVLAFHSAAGARSSESRDSLFGVVSASELGDSNASRCHAQGSSSHSGSVRSNTNAPSILDCRDAVRQTMRALEVQTVAEANLNRDIF